MHLATPLRLAQAFQRGKLREMFYPYQNHQTTIVVTNVIEAMPCKARWS